MPMTPTGFPPQQSQATFLSLMTSLRERAETARTEAVTGRAADIASHLGGATAEVLALEKDLADLETYRTTIALGQSRAAVQQRSLGEVAEIATRLSADAQTAMQDTADISLETVSKIAEDALGAMVGLLNVSYGGRSLFGGDASDQGAMMPAGDILTRARTIVSAAPDAATAFADLTAMFTDPLNSDYPYLGGTGDAPEVEIAPGERVQPNARADERPILEILRNVTAIAVAFDPSTPPPIQDELAGLAMDGDGVEFGLRELMDPLNRIRGRIGSAEARMETLSARNAAEETRITESLVALTGRDSLEAAVEMQALEGQLETLFLTTARFSQLSLGNFLR